MPEAKITIRGEDLASDVAKRVGDEFQAMAGWVKESGAAAHGAGDHVSQLRRHLEELTPSTDSAHSAFSSFQTTLTEMWEHPKQAIGELVEAISHDLGPSLGAIGVGSGVAAAALTVLGTAAFEVAEHVAAVGASIERGSIISSIGAEQFSALKFAVEATGGSVDTLTNAAFMLERRLGDTGATGEKTRAALKDLGISADDFVHLPVDQQVLAISNGFRGLGEDANKSSIAFGLMGRQGREMLPTLMKPMEDLAQKAHELGLTWSEEDVKAAHELEVQVNILRLEFQKLQTDIGKDLIPIFTEPLQFAEHSLGWLLTKGPVGEMLHELKFMGDLVKAANEAESSGAVPKVKSPFETGDSTIKDVTHGLSVEVWGYNDALIEAAKQEEKFRQAVQSSKDALEGDTKTVRAQVAAIDQVVRAGISDEEVQNRVFEAITKLEAKGITLTDTIYAWDAANKELLDSTNLSATALDRYVAIAETANATGETFAGVARAMRDDVAGFGIALPTARFGEFHELLTGLSDTITNDGVPALASFALETDVAAGKTESFAEQSQHLRDALVDVRKTASYDFFDGFVQSLESIPAALERAFEGGGGLGGAMHSIEAKFGSHLGEGIVKSIPGSMTSILGSTVGGFMDVALPGIGGAIGALAGPAISGLMSIFGPSEESAKVNNPRQVFIDAAGGLDELNAKVMTATGSLAEVQRLLGAKTEKDYKSAIDAINKSLGDFNKSLSDAAAAEHTVADKMSHLSSISPALEQALKTAYDVKSPNDYLSAIKEINGILDTEAGKQKHVNDTLHEFGLTALDAGKEFRQTQIDSTADHFIDAFRTMRSAGVDVYTEMDHMKGPLNQFVKDAQKAGVEVPRDMQEVLQVAIDTGKLYDDNGKKIENIDDLHLKFGDTAPKALDNVAKAIKDLADVLDQKLTPNFANAALAAQGIVDNINKIPSEKHFRAVFDAADVPSTSFANEGYDLTRPVRAIIGDNPTQPESVLHAQTVKDIVRAARNAGEASGNAELAARLDALHGTTKRLADTMTRMLTDLPFLMRHVAQTT